MKITAAQYAKSLYESVSDKSRSEVDALVGNLARILVRNRQQKLLSKIVAEFSAIHDRQTGIVEAEVTTQTSLDKEARERVIKFIKEKYSAKEVVIRNILDEKLGGGMIVRVGDEVLDGGIARQLEELRNNLAK